MVNNFNLFNFRVTSSEKVDKEKRYSEFSLCCVPYPGAYTEIMLIKNVLLYAKRSQFCSWSWILFFVKGCEFFRVLKSRDHVSQKVYFDWNQVTTMYIVRPCLSSVCHLFVILVGWSMKEARNRFLTLGESHVYIRTCAFGIASFVFCHQNS